MHVLVTLPISEEQKGRLVEAASDKTFVFENAADITEKDLEGAEIILGNIKKASDLAYCRHLRWVHLSNAGVDDYLKPGILPDGVDLANGTGAYGPAISEYMVGTTFMLYKKLDHYMRDQVDHTWHQDGQVRLVQGSTVLVLGLGDIGSSYAMKMKALGCHVIGVKRRPSEKPEWLDELYTEEMTDALLERADIVAMSLPGTKETYHFLNARRIGMMKQDAIVINVGRGVCIDTEALTEALYEKRIGGAALDVIEGEPLRADHPIWDAPRAVITPHISGRTMQPDTLDRLVSMFAENLKKDKNGEPLSYLVDLQTGYQQ